MQGIRSAIALTSIAALAQAGCVSHEVRTIGGTEAIVATEELAEESLLDIGITEFDPGLPEEGKKLDDDIYPEVRKAEARYIPYHLKDTLQYTGQWGSVRLTPTTSDVADVNVSGTIIKSDGERVVLQVHAVDATGRTWLKKKYIARTTSWSYRADATRDGDPYQDVFNMIANDLVAARDLLEPRELKQIRTVAELRFARSLAPEAFEGHLEQGRNGRYTVNRLPARNDPMVERMLQVREREYLFVDTLNEHYEKFYGDMNDPYNEYRKYAREEAIAVRELRASSRWRKILGAAMIIGAATSSSDSRMGRVARDAAIFGGVEIFKSGLSRSAEAKVHAASLGELGGSFEAEVTPMVVEIEGNTHRLTGNAEAQYMEWRRLLQQLYMAETGLMSEMDIYTDTDLNEITPPVMQEPAPPNVSDGANSAAAPVVEQPTG